MGRDMTRQELFDDFNLQPGYYSGLAKKYKVTLPTMMNRLAPEATSGYPQDAMSEMLARHRLEVSGNATDASSSIEEFLDSGSELGPKETMFWATLERDYDIATSVYDLEQKMKLNATTSLVSDSPEGGAARPRSTRMLYENNKFRPPVSITDIAGGIETIPGQTWQVANYDTPASDERSTTIPEAGPIPLTTLTTGEATGRTKKVGAGLSISREFELNSTLMSEVRTWVRRQGMRDEIRIVNEGVNLLKSSVTSDNTENIGSVAVLGLDAIIEVNTYFGSGSGYMLDLLLGTKPAVHQWIRANVGNPITGAVNEVRRGYPAGAFGSVFNNIELVNRASGPTRVAYFDDTSATTDPNVGNTLVNTELLGIDSRWSLILYRQARGVTNENRYDPSTQVRDYFLTQRFGWHLQDVNAIARFVYA